MTKAEEIEMCDDLNFLINVIISYIYKNYEKFHEGFRQIFDFELKQYQSYFNENSNEIITAGTLLNTVYVCIVIKILSFKNSKQHYMSMLIRSILSDSQTVSGTSADAVSERFITTFKERSS